jgi:hypothetical protein
MIAIRTFASQSAVINAFLKLNNRALLVFHQHEVNHLLVTKPVKSGCL